MRVILLEPISALASVNWSPSQAISSLLSKHSIKHGFTGIQGSLPLHAHFCSQVHGVDIACAEEAANGFGVKERQPADGVWTAKSGACVAVKTADCLPVLLATTDGRYVAAIHAGWRGLVAGILPRAVQLLLEQSCLHSSSLIACIGPSISREAFEVGPEVIDATASASFALDANARSLTISKGSGDRWHLDLASAAALQLVAQGLAPQNIEVIQACTKTLDREWHSYRREGRGCGVNWSWLEASLLKRPSRPNKYEETPKP